MCFAMILPRLSKTKKKAVLFKKGHVVKEEDIPALLSVGKEHLFVWEKQDGNPSRKRRGQEIL